MVEFCLRGAFAALALRMLILKLVRTSIVAGAAALTVAMGVAACGQACQEDANGDCFPCGHVDGHARITKCPHDLVCDAEINCKDCEGACIVADD